MGSVIVVDPLWGSGLASCAPPALGGGGPTWGGRETHRQILPVIGVQPPDFSMDKGGSKCREGGGVKGVRVCKHNEGPGAAVLGVLAVRQGGAARTWGVNETPLARGEF